MIKPRATSEERLVEYLNAKVGSEIRGDRSNVVGHSLPLRFRRRPAKRAKGALPVEEEDAFGFAGTGDGARSRRAGADDGDPGDTPGDPCRPGRGAAMEMGIEEEEEEGMTVMVRVDGFSGSEESDVDEGVLARDGAEATGSTISQSILL